MFLKRKISLLCMIALSCYFLFPKNSHSQNTKKQELNQLYNIVYELSDRNKFDSLIIYDSIIKQTIKQKNLPKDTTYGKILLKVSHGYYGKGQYIIAEAYCLDAIDIFEKHNHLERKNYTYTCLHNIYLDFKNYKKAKFYLQEAYKYYNSEQKEDSVHNSSLLKDFAILYFNLGDLDSSMLYCRQVLKYPPSFTKARNIANLTLADVFIQKGNYDSALYYTNIVLKKLSPKNHTRLAETYQKLFNINYALKKHTDAKVYAQKNLEEAKISGSKLLIKNAYENFYKYYEATNEYTNALIYIKKYNALKDSLFNSENEKQLIELQAKYNYDRQRSIDKAEQEKKDVIYAIKTKKQQFNTTLARIGIILALGVIIGLFVAYSRKRKINAVLSNQKKIIESKNNLIIDSITYAKKIQNSMLPRHDKLRSIFSDYFIVYKAKDIVSGDFYWFDIHDEQALFSVADCTGHGVPGAFMSILGISFIEQVVKENNFNIAPNKVLENLNKSLEEKIHRSGNQEFNDGMELVFAKYNKDTKLLEYAGTKNNFLLIRNNEVFEHKTDKAILGKHINTQFSNKELQLESGDQLYFFSDGLPTQKSGETKIKMGIEKFKAFMLDISKTPFTQQKEKTETLIKTWIDNYEQFDDILILGIKI